MRFETARWGTLEVAEDKLLHFASGLPGFQNCTSFIVMDHDRETPLKWLQCVDRPEVSFLVVEPEQIMSSFEVEVPPEVFEALGWDKPPAEDEVSVFVILNIDEETLTANLRAPIVVNIATRAAHQLILDDGSAPLRHVVAPEG